MSQGNWGKVEEKITVGEEVNQGTESTENLLLQNQWIYSSRKLHKYLGN